MIAVSQVRKGNFNKTLPDPRDLQAATFALGTMV